MEENKVVDFDQDLEDLKRNKSRVKVLIYANIILFFCDLLSLLFSIFTKQENVIESKEIGYFIVLGVSIIVFVVAFILLKKLGKKITNLESKNENMDE